MISAGEFRNGVTMEYEGNIYQIIEFQHVKPGKGAAFVRTKLKNLVSGAVVEKTFRPTEKMPKADIFSIERICHIFTMMASFTTLWMLKLMTRFLFLLLK